MTETVPESSAAGSTSDRAPRDRTADDDRAAPDLARRVQEILDLIRPAVQSDGGDLELVDVSDDGVVRVRFHGACVGCPSSTMTLQVGIERQLKDHVPGVRSVQAVG